MSTESHILDTSENLFNHHGYTSVGVDLIRDESGVSKTTIYRYFSNKNGLIIAILKRRHERFKDSLSKNITNANGVENKLLALLSWHYDWFSSSHFDGCMFMHALSEFKHSNNVISNIAIEHKKWIKGVIDSILLENIPSYHSSKTDLILSIIEGLIINVEFFRVPPPIETYKNILIHIMNSQTSQ